MQMRGPADVLSLRQYNSGGSMNVLHKTKYASWGYLAAIVSCGGLIALSPATRSLAADPTPASSTPGSNPAVPDAAILEEVTVTAQRVRENLQRVPIDVTAATGLQAEQRGAYDIQSLSDLVPGVVSTGNTSNFTYIRGVGSSNQSLNNEGAVATYIDGVYMPSSFGAFGKFNEFDLARIEVLKGPQGTQFGRDTTGGVIQIITPDPRQEFGADVSLGYGNYDTVDGVGYVTGGITDTLSADLALTYEDQMHGWGHNLTTGQPAGTDEDYAARSKWLWTPWDATKVTAQFDYSLFRTTAGLQMAPGSIDPYDHVTTYDGRFNFVGIDYRFNSEQYGDALHVDHEFSNGLHFVSITSYRQLNGYESHDNTRSYLPLYTVSESSHSNFETQEFQLIDQNPGRFTWLLGGYYFGDTVAAEDPRLQTGSLVNAAGYLAIDATQKIRSYSPYAQESTELFDHTKLDLGLRYTDESVRENGQYENAAGQIVTPSNSLKGATPYENTLKYTPWTYRAALDHQFDQDVMGYLSFTHGFKSGGFNLPTPQRNPYLPEKINSYEVGLKSEFLDHRVRLNLSAYLYNYTDIQVVIVPGLAGQLFTNAGAAKADGIDADFQFAATQHLSVFAGFNYLHGYYTNFPDAQRYTASGVGVIIPNAAGYALPYAPRSSGNVGFTYTAPTSIGDFVFTPTVAYTDKYLFTTDTSFYQSRVIMVNAQAEWDSQAIKGLAVRLWGRNLANEYYMQSLIESTGGWYQVPAAPRTYGVTLLKRF
jgi:iron complex outermembrane receptor protein